MKTEDFKLIQETNPDAVRVWFDRMHDLNKGELLETLIVHMDREFFSGLILRINDDIITSRAEEANDNE
jgi:hypothetical protein